MLLRFLLLLSIAGLTAHAGADLRFDRFPRRPPGSPGTELPYSGTPGGHRFQDERALARTTRTRARAVRAAESRPAERVLENEIELAHYLRDTRGFTIVAPEEETLSEVAAKCTGAEVVVGVEGSQLFNGIMFLADAGSVVAIQL